MCATAESAVPDAFRLPDGGGEVGVRVGVGVGSERVLQPRDDAVEAVEA